MLTRCDACIAPVSLVLYTFSQKTLDQPIASLGLSDTRAYIFITYRPLTFAFSDHLWYLLSERRFSYFLCVGKQDIILKLLRNSAGYFAIALGITVSVTTLLTVVGRRIITSDQKTEVQPGVTVFLYKSIERHLSNLGGYYCISAQDCRRYLTDVCNMLKKRQTLSQQYIR